MATVAVESVFGANSTTLKQHASSIEMAGETSVVQSDGIPLVSCIDVDSGLEEIAKAVNVAGPRSGKNVAVWDLLEGNGRAEIGRVEVDAVEV